MFVVDMQESYSNFPQLIENRCATKNYCTSGKNLKLSIISPLYIIKALVMVVPGFLPKSYYTRTCTNYNTLYIITSCQKKLLLAHLHQV